MHKTNADMETENKPLAHLDFRKLAWIAATLVVLATFIVYLPALQNGFVNWDDHILVYENPTLRSIDIPFIGWALTDVSTGLWHPMLWLSFALDYTAWGLNPFGYHLTNIIFHSINTLLVFILVVRLLETGGYSLDKKTLVAATVTALLFGIHPLHVESVVWVTERKDVLYSFFYLLSILSYIRYVSTASKRLNYYSASLILYSFALMSKPMAVSLPLVLLIIDFYPLKRLTICSGLKNIRWTLVEKLPFLLLSLLLSLMTLLVHPSAETAERYPFIVRLLMATHTLMLYFVKMLLPFNIVPLYPSVSSYLTFEYMLFFMGFVIITLFAFRSLKKNKLFSSLWFYYIVTLIPVLGIFAQHGRQLMADRYTYLSSLGPFLLAGIGIDRVLNRCSKKALKVLIIAALIIIISILGIKTTSQITIWKDSMTLWSYVIKHFPDTAYIAYNNRGSAYDSMGNYQQALMDFNKVIKINPEYAEAYRNRGLIFSKLRNFQQALKDINRAIELNTTKPAIGYNSRGSVYVNSGDYQKAIEDFSMAIELAPLSADAYYNRGTAYRRIEDNYRAINDFSMVIRLNPQYAEAYNNRGNAYRDLGNYQRAIEDYNIAIKLNPKDAIAYRNRGITYKNMGNHEKAMNDFNKADELRHNSNLKSR